MDDQRATNAGILNGVSLIFAHLIRELDRAKLLSKDDFAAALSGGADYAEQSGGAPPVGVRADVLLLRNLAKLLADPPQPGWIPRVVQGGKAPRKPEGS